jgi:hypothetical protein
VNGEIQMISTSMDSSSDLYVRARRAFAAHREVVSRAMISELSEAGAQGVAVIRRLWLKETAPSLRRWVVEAAGACPGRWVRPLIRQALTDPAMTVRLHALLAIDHRRDRTLAAEALPLTKDASGGIRTNCLALVADLKPEGWQKAVKKGLRDPKAYVRTLCQKIQATEVVCSRPRKTTVR